MCGPLPSHRPVFPSTFLEAAEKSVRHRTVPYQLRQRAALVLLLSQQPLVSNIEAAAQGQLPAGSVQRWRRRWATGDFSLDDKPGRGRTADFSPSGPCAGQGGRLCTGRRNSATVASAVAGRRHRTSRQRAGHTDQSQHGVADSPYGCYHTVAGQILDLSTGSPLRRKGWTDAGPLCGSVARPAPGSQGPHPARRREDQHPGPPPLPSLPASRATPRGLY